MLDDPVQWWRFDRYEIVEGALRPALDATLEMYNPWDRFFEVKGCYRTVRTLWGEFAGVLDRIEGSKIGPFEPSREGAEAILEWSNKQGLLGLLPARALRIELPPMYRPARDYFLGDASNVQSATEHSNLVPVRRTYERVAGHWLEGREPELAPPIDHSGLSLDQPAPITRDQQFNTVWWDWIDFKWETRPTSELLSGYFPKTIPTAHYARPLSTQFWTQYQEPVSAWHKAALSFTHSLKLVSDYANERFQKGTEAGERELTHGIWLLNSLASAETTYFDFDTFVLKEHWSSASLLSAMAKMFLLDLMAKRRLFRCGACNVYFVSNDLIRAKYCSNRCRNTSQVQRTRERLKHAASSRR